MRSKHEVRSAINRQAFGGPLEVRVAELPSRQQAGRQATVTKAPILTDTFSSMGGSQMGFASPTVEGICKAGFYRRLHSSGYCCFSAFIFGKSL